MLIKTIFVIIICTNCLNQPNESIKLEVRLEEENVWLTQNQIAELFGTEVPAISKHIRNIYQSEELNRTTTLSKMEIVRQEGTRLVKRNLDFYNLDVILSIGYRVIRTALPPVEGVFYDGQIFDAYKFATDLIKSANHSLVLIDNYVDETTLLMLSKRKEGVNVTIYTQRINPQLQLDLEKHNAQYPAIDIRTYKRSHDRFLLIDGLEVYHIGASLKDLGKKMFAFSKLNESADMILQLVVDGKNSH